MSHIGILGESYPLFDWTASNGSATAEQTRRGWNALTGQGLCREFSRLVWNDILQTAADALDNLGLGWDGSILDLPKTKILQPLGALTAKQFNSAVHNIARLMPQRWAWERSTGLPGFLGRREMLGVSQAGDAADLLYGWYITELVQGLNTGIRLWRGDGLNENLQSGYAAARACRTELGLWLKKELAAFCPVSEACRSLLRIIVFLHTPAQAKSRSETCARGEYYPAKHVAARTVSETSQRSRPEPIPPVPAAFRGCSDALSQGQTALIYIRLLILRRVARSLCRSVVAMPAVRFARGRRKVSRRAKSRSFAANVGFCRKQTLRPAAYTGGSVTHKPEFIRWAWSLCPAGYTGSGFTLPPVFAEGVWLSSLVQRGFSQTMPPLFSGGTYRLPPVDTVYTGAELGEPLFAGAYALCPSRTKEVLEAFPGIRTGSRSVAYAKGESSPGVIGSRRLETVAGACSAARSHSGLCHTETASGMTAVAALGKGGSVRASAAVTRIKAATPVRSEGRLLVLPVWQAPVQTASRLEIYQTHSANQTQNVLEVY